MLANGRSWLLTSALVFGLSAMGGVALAQSPDDTAGGESAEGGKAQEQSANAAAGRGGCPVRYSTLKSALEAAVAADTSGFNNEMWAAVVDRVGVVCAVAFSGDDLGDQWLGSRQIAASKAFTANGFSLDIDGTGSGPLSTANLFPLVQPQQSLFGLCFGNPLNPTLAYKGPTNRWGTANDPLVGKRVGGCITFGGGLALYKGGKTAIGGLGLSGDTACADHSIAWRMRNALGLAPTGEGDKINLGEGGHARCPNDNNTQGATF